MHVHTQFISVASSKRFEADDPCTVRCTVAWHARMCEGLLHDLIGSALKARPYAACTPHAAFTADAQQRVPNYVLPLCDERRPWDQDKYPFACRITLFFCVQSLSEAPCACLSRLEMTRRMRGLRWFALVGIASRHPMIGAGRVD